MQEQCDALIKVLQAEADQTLRVKTHQMNLKNMQLRES